MSEAYFIDSSIPIYAAGKPSEHKEACGKLLARIEARELEAAIDTEVIQEILYRFHRLELNAKGLELCNNVMRLGMRVLPVSRSDIQEALLLFEKYAPSKVPPRDTLHAAVMINNGMTKVVTLDKHFGDAIKEVQRINPESLLR